MNLQIQQSVAEFVERHNLEIDVAHRLLDLVSETGEVAKEVLKSTEYGRTGFQPNENWEEELGDLFFALLCLANSSGIDLEIALQKALGKYESRLASRKDAGSGR